MGRIKSGLLFTILMLGISLNFHGQAVINEITADGQIEIKNIGSDTVNLEDFWICNRPQYERIGALSVECGDLNLLPGSEVTIRSATFTLAGAGDELGIFINSQFSNSASIMDYVIWGERAGATRESVAIAAGIWTEGDRAPLLTDSLSLQYDGEGEAGSDYAAAASTICLSDMMMDTTMMVDTMMIDTMMMVDTMMIDTMMIDTMMMVDTMMVDTMMMDTCIVTAGVISFPDSLSAISVCLADSTSDNIDVSLTGAVGSLMSWVITDTAGVILELPLGPPFNFSGTDPGVCLIWHLSYESGLEGAAIGENASGITGCFALSNAISVTREASDVCGPNTCEADAGQILAQDSLTELSICVDDDSIELIELSLTGNSGSNSSWLVTDTSLNILSIDTSNIIDLDGSEAGVALLWHISYEDDIVGLAVDNNVADLTGCYSVSNSILVNKLSGADCGGQVVCELNQPSVGLASGAQDTSVCSSADLISIDLVLDESIMNPDSVITGEILTDADGIILAYAYISDTSVVGAPEDVTAFFNDLDENTLLQRAIVFDGAIGGLELGASIDDLSGCFALSDAFTFNISNISASELSVSDSLTEVSICTDDDVLELIEVVTTGGNGTTSTWLLTDTLGIILDINDNNVFDLEPLGPGVSLIWEVKHDGSLEGVAIDSSASNLSGCFALSNAITVTRVAGDDCPPPPCSIEGGTLSIADSGATELSICAGDGMSDAFNVVLEGADGPNSAWIIADEDGNILAFPLAPPFDFEGAGAGTALVYSLVFENGLGGASLGGNVNDLDGCFDLSNPITVSRQMVSGGNLELASGGDRIEVCDDGTPFTAFDVILTGAVGSSTRFVITDGEGVIINFPLSAPFDLDGTQPGTNLLWNISAEDGATGIEIGMNANDIMGCVALSNPITIIRNRSVGGVLRTPEGTDNISICAGDGISDAFDVVLTDAEGPQSTYVVTDTAGTIIMISDSPTFDFEGAGEGVCLIWHISHGDDLTGAVVDSSANDLAGCFELSNPVTVTRLSGDNCPPPCLADGGIASITGGDTSISICADDGLSDAFTIEVSGASGPNTAWMVTDEDGNILGFPDTTIVNLEGAGPGVSLVINISYDDDVTLPEVGGNVSELSGCFSLSAPITVNRMTGDDCETVCVVFGGEITTADGETEQSICADDGEADPITIVSTGAVGSENTYLITDADAMILDIAMGNVIDLEGTGAGVCLLWEVSHIGTLSGAALGANANDIEGCFAFSNPITVTRLTGEECLPLCGVDGGDVMYEDGTNEIEFCSGDVGFTVTHTSEADPELEYYYVLTDSDDIIVDVRNSADGGEYDMSQDASGISHLWGWSTDGSITAVIGDSIQSLVGNCNDLSGDFVNISRLTGGVCDEGCHAPRDVRIRKSSGTRYSVRWDKVKEAIGYIMEIGFEGIPESFAAVPVQRTKVTVNGPADRVIVIRVRAICADGEMSPFTRDFFINTSSTNIRSGATLRSGDKIEVSEIMVTEQQPLFPNPAGDYINVWYDGQGVSGDLRVFGRDGREVLQATLSGQTENHEVDIQTLSNGLYFLMVRSDGDIWMQEKFIKSDRF